jgi:chromosome segregation ATPase
MNQTLRGRGRQTLRKLSTVKASRPATKREVAALRRRVSELEDELQEARRLHRRLAELTDVVQELLVPLAQRDEEKVRRYLDRYSTAL